MINVDAVDFSERRPGEVMFLLTLSVCIQKPIRDVFLTIYPNYTLVLMFKLSAGTGTSGSHQQTLEE